ncbi:MAG: glycoside hydrolase family 2 protein [Armatimonadetes bacterium]|nr:glycoside hydrolase family 2 protein [Candidatus Hippobium faecium]
MNFIDLNGVWTLKNEKKNINCSASVPGCVHTDLLAAGIIDDPFYRDNEFTQMWVCYEDWTWEREFEAGEDFLKNSRIFLECEGLDTFATVYINGTEIAKTKNMHRRYAFDIKEVLRPGKNSIKVFIASAPVYSEPIADTGTAFGPGDYSIKGSERVRKAMYQWGWDWGPKIPTAGIWRNIGIKAYNEIKIDDFHIKQNLSEGKVRFDFEISGDKFAEGNVNYEIEIKDPEGKSLGTVKGECDGSAKNSFTVENPAIWYPTGYGDQPLYTFVLKTGDEEITKTQGVRKIEWVEDKDQWGRTFYVRVNGIPIFAKGADYIPMDQFPSRVKFEDYDKMLDTVLETNMNCIRIWGGGIYEADMFYDLCDRKGILVWQDFAYACAHYSLDDPELNEEYELEAEDNVKRLRHHASIALWCGNNELEQFYDCGFPYGWLSNEPHKAEFKELFYVRIKNICNRLDEERFYIGSSSHSEEIFKDPNGHDSGDTHYWDVWHGRKPFTDYRKYHSRFLSEFGFQGMPSLETIKTFTVPDDRNIYSRIMENHQKFPWGGNETILYYLAQNYRMPDGFRNLIYVSQILQADAIRYGVEHFRRNRNDFRCMGTTYWQLNDCWPVTSWASVEYGGRWKALNFMAREFFKPVDLTIEEDDHSVKLHIVNDTVNDFKGCVKYQLCKTDGEVIFADTMEGCCKALSANMIKEIDLTEYIEKYGKFKVFFSCGLDDMAEKHVFFTPAKYMELEKPCVKVEAQGDMLKVVTDKPSFYTQIDVPDTKVRLERNFILLLPGKEYFIKVAENDGLSAKEIAEKSAVISVATTY